MATGARKVPMPQQRPRVVILGGGFGGLECAKTLGRTDVDITVIDRENYHCFQPLLYQVATAALSPAEVAWPIRHILRRQKNATVFMAEVTGIDAAEQIVTANGASFPYDFLVIATGAMHSYFGHDGWAAFAPGLKRIEDATRIRRGILSAFEQAELADDETERRRLLTFVIVGGGPTGVEMAGAIAEVARQTLARDFRRIDPRTSRIVLIEAGSRLLPAFSEHHSQYAQNTLAAMGVEVLTATRVTCCNARGVDLEHGNIEAGSVVWAAGVYGFARGQLASGRTRQIRPRHRALGSLVARTREHLCDRRYCRGKGCCRSRGAWPCVRRQTDGQLCRPVHCVANLRPDDAAVPLSQSRYVGHDRTPLRRGRAGAYSAQGLCRLGILERGAHLLSDRAAQSLCRGRDLALELHHLPTRRAVDHRSPGTAGRMMQANREPRPYSPLNQL